jgi:hypothetical protein
LNLINIIPKTGQLDIVVQVSNYSFRESGIFGDIEIGQPFKMMKHVFNRYVFNAYAKTPPTSFHAGCAGNRSVESPSACHRIGIRRGVALKETTTMVME